VKEAETEGWDGWWKCNQIARPVLRAKSDDTQGAEKEVHA
jgi:hypothetical protein